MNQERLFTVVLGPHISEKAAISADEADQYVFKVAIDANKLEIRNAVEKLFNVKVIGVKTVKVKGKVKRNKYGFSKRSDFKKAVVRLAQGHEIDFAAFE